VASNSAIRGDWWRDDLTRHEAVTSLVRALDAEQQYRQTANLTHLQLYGGQDFRGLAGNLYAQAGSTGSRLRLNVVRSMAATATSKIAKIKTRCLAMTEGGNFSQQQRARKLTKAIAGLFYESDIYAKGQKAFLDSCIFDVGALHIFAEGDKIKVERVFPNEIRVDDAEAINGEPRSMHRVRMIAREVLLTAYTEHEKEIRDAPKGNELWSGLAWKPDLVQAIESWHLPSGEGAGDGRHSITLATCTLLDEEYGRDYFPFETLRWDEMPLGYYGSGLAGQLAPLQYEINKLLLTIQRCMHLSTPYILVESGSSVNKSHINNELWNILEYTGPNAPTPVTPPVIHPQVLEQLNQLYARAYEITGISQLSAQAKKPEGLDSGKALREYNDLESERFQMVSQRYEQFYLACAHKMVDLAREIHARTGKFSVRSPQRGNVDVLDWGDVDLERDEYVMQLVPTAFLPSTPAGKLATIQEMLQAGLIERDDALSLLDYPDLEAVAGLQNAPLRNIDMRIERMLDADNPQYHPPEPYMNLQLAVKRVTSAYEQAQMNGAPEKNLEFLRRYLADCQALIDQSQQPAQSPQAQSMVPQAPPPEASAGLSPVNLVNPG
jgi:hypothetical protein